MTEQTEPTVQVSVSLIEQMREALAGGPAWTSSVVRVANARRALDALLTQPTPTAEPTSLTERLAELREPVNGHRPYCLSNQPGDGACNCDMDQHPSLPTREQIAEVLWSEAVEDGDDPRWTWAYLTERANRNEGDYADIRAEYYRTADAILALIQKGADR